MDYRNIARLLRKAIMESEYQSDLYTKMNGFNIISGTETKVCPEKLAAKVSMLADILEESYNQSKIDNYDGENARFG